MNRRTLERFRKWFVKEAPDGLDFEDPHALLERMWSMDARKYRVKTDEREAMSAPEAFIWELVCEFEVMHISPEELGPVLVEAAAAVTLRS